MHSIPPAVASFSPRLTLQCEPDAAARIGRTYVVQASRDASIHSILAIAVYLR